MVVRGGGDWLVNFISYFHPKKVQITGVDLNSVEIKYANEIKEKYNIECNFTTSDIFNFNAQ